MKKLLSLVLALALAACFAMPAAAEYLVETQQDENYEKSDVVDMADLLTDDEEADLLNTIEEIKSEYNYEIVIVTAPTLNGKGIMEFADDFYDYNNYGCGSSNDGMIFVIDMDERDYWTSTTGYGIKAFTDYGLGELHDSMVSYLSDGNYYDAFNDYLTTAKDFLRQAKNGAPYDVDNQYNGGVSGIIAQELIILLVAAVIAGITVVVMSLKMNTAVKQSRAANYVVDNSFRLQGQNDMYLYSTVTKTKIVENTSSGGGSSTHVGSSGVSHGGGGGKF